MIVRWLEGEEVELFYKRLQAHFDAAMTGFREDQKHSNEWKADAETLAFLGELDKVEVNMAERYLREVIKEHKLFVLSTQTADEINIAYLADHIMSVPVEDLVGRQSAPPEASESDLAWFFKLFSLRGMNEGLEQMCFFVFFRSRRRGSEARHCATGATKRDTFRLLAGWEEANATKSHILQHGYVGILLF